MLDSYSTPIIRVSWYFALFNTYNTYGKSRNRLWVTGAWYIYVTGYSRKLKQEQFCLNLRYYIFGYNSKYIR